MKINSNSKILAAVFCCVFAVLVLVPAFGSIHNDPYSVEEVKALLKQPSGFSSGFSEKQIARLGDRVSIALLKIYPEKELKMPENIKRYLPLVVGAFGSRDLITMRDDQNPQVTLMLLKCLESDVTDGALRQSIRNAEIEIKGLADPK